MNRRELLAGIIATPVAAAIPDVAASAPAASTAGLPAWSVGTPGENNWHVFFCRTQDEAVALWRDWESDDDEWIEAKREPKFDNPDNADPDCKARYLAGWTVYCERCHIEVERGDGESDVVANGDVVCTGCMTIDEWEVRDPERAAEMREDAAA